jgi:hypothetical protein
LEEPHQGAAIAVHTHGEQGGRFTSSLDDDKDKSIGLCTKIDGPDLQVLFSSIKIWVALT